MRLCYDLSAGAALILRLCCAFEPLLYKSAGNPGSAAVDHQPLNKMDNRIVPVAMIQLAIMNQRLARLDEENQLRRRRAKRFWVCPWLCADRRLQFGHSGGGGSGSAWGAGAWRAGAWDAPSCSSGWVTVVSCTGLRFCLPLLTGWHLETWESRVVKHFEREQIMTIAVEVRPFYTLISSSAVAMSRQERSISAEETQLKHQERRGWAIPKL